MAKPIIDLELPVMLNQAMKNPKIVNVWITSSLVIFFNQDPSHLKTFIILILGTFILGNLGAFNLGKLNFIKNSF
jgi:hypothetical protein